jgi:hypothetical protein
MLSFRGPLPDGSLDSDALTAPYLNLTLSTTAREALAIQPPASTCLAISMSRSQAGDDTPTGVVTS